MRTFLQYFFSHRSLASLRWDLHMVRLRLRNRLRRQHAAIRAHVKAMPQPRYLNLGSGPRGLDSPNWINVDAFPDKNVQFLLDFTRPLPFEDHTLDGVFCEHVLEHFSYQDGLRLASDIARTLQPGGTFRVIVPDGPWLMRSYFDRPDELIRYRALPNVTAMEVVNHYFRQRYEHHFIYDFETMKKMLLEAGFTSVSHSSHGDNEGTDPLVLDDPKYAQESLYVVARK